MMFCKIMEGRKHKLFYSLLYAKQYWAIIYVQYLLI